MILTFPKAAVKELLDHAFAAAQHNPTFGEMYDPALRKDGKKPGPLDLPEAEDVNLAKVKPGLWLVGDDGVYLVSNGLPMLMASERGQKVAYANEANPETMDPDAVWDAKNGSFGGDDGVDKIDGHDCQNWIDLSPGEVVRLRISRSQMELLVGKP
jgi:hypothetical protein